jgi:methylated-DNA-protein-cysteine methyltransferase-like protein
MFNPPNRNAYFEQVYALVEQIPPGKVATYGQLGKMIPPPEGTEPERYDRVAARWVGAAMRHAPGGLPWYRVINSQGKISLPAGDGAEVQRAHLEAEGVVFDRNGRVNLKVYRWDGRSSS